MIFKRRFYGEAVLLTFLAIGLTIGLLQQEEDIAYLYVTWSVWLVLMLLPSNIDILPPRFHSAKQYHELAENAPRHKISWQKATEKCTATQEQYVVIGGSGFVGVRIVHALLLRGETKVRVVDVDLHAMAALKTQYGDKVELVIADVTKIDELRAALEGAQCVYATFAILRFWESLSRHRSRMTRVNVDASRILVELCIAIRISRLIVTSSSAAVQPWPAWSEDGITDDEPRCNEENSATNYCLSKALQEELVLKANGKQGLATGCIRPCSGVFGFGDKLLLKISLDSKTAPVISPSAWNDFVHVDCIVLAHLLLEARLRNGSMDPAAGKAYNISNNEPLQYATWAALLEQISSEQGQNIKMMFIPSRLVALLTFVVSSLEYVYPGDLVRLIGRGVGTLTVPTILLGSQNFIVRDNSRLAKQLLGYEPFISVASAIELTLREYKENRPIME